MPARRGWFILILVPETTSEPMSTGMPESVRNGFIRTVKATPERKTATAVSGTATRRMRTCRLWRTAPGNAQIPIGAAKRPNDPRPSRGAPGYSRERVHPRPIRPRENQAAPLDISLFWPPMVAPKYGPGAARPLAARVEDPAGKAGLL